MRNVGHVVRWRMIPAQRLFANAPGALLVPHKLPRARLEQSSQSPLNDKARVAIGTMKTVLFDGKGTMTAAWTAQQLTQPRCLGGFTGRIQRLSKEAHRRGLSGMVQMRVTPGPQNQAQRTQSVSPIGLVVNGLHCAASHTHTTSLRCHPHVPTFEPCRLSANLATSRGYRLGWPQRRRYLQFKDL